MTAARACVHDRRCGAARLEGGVRERATAWPRLGRGGGTGARLDEEPADAGKAAVSRVFSLELDGYVKTFTK
jgi:hypothetical protein